MAMVGVVGWRVWDTRKTETSSASLPPSKNEKEAKSNTPSDDFTTVSDGLKQYQYTIGTSVMRYKPAEGWNIESKRLAESKEDYNRGQIVGSIVLKSPDYKVEESDNPDEYCAEYNLPKTGTLIRISIEKDTLEAPTPKRIDEIISGAIDVPAAWDAKPTTVGGLKAVGYNHGPGECFSNYSTEVALDGYSISITTDSEDMNKPDLAKLYNDLLSTIKFD